MEQVRSSSSSWASLTSRGSRWSVGSAAWPAGRHGRRPCGASVEKENVLHANPPGTKILICKKVPSKLCRFKRGTKTFLEKGQKFI